MMRNFYGTNGRDIFDGGRQGERVFGYGGDDDLYGYGGDDILLGGDGRDLLVGGDGDDELKGGTGSDLLAGERGDDRLDGGSGFDYVDYFFADAGVTVDLTAGTAADGEGGTDALRSVEGVYGSRNADTIRGDAGTNELFGEAGNDVLVGGAGQDLTVGDAGADRFVFADGDVADRLGRADLIGDFARSEGDTIDLAGIDANTNVAGDQAFTFLGRGAFTGTAGEIRYQVIDGESVLMADVDGYRSADAYIRFDTPELLVSSDFQI